jgi:hypothetical protein
MSYQTGEVLPYWFKTQILRRKGLPAPSLYQKAQLDQVEAFAGFSSSEKDGVKDV